MEFKEKYGSYEHIASGKVREIYQETETGDILLVATDRVSAFDKKLDVIIPDKGKVLTAISTKMLLMAENSWILPTALICANVVSANAGGDTVGNEPDKLFINPDGTIPPELVGRVTQMKPLTMFKIECIVRGHISGSAWKLYKKGGREICGERLPEGLVNGSKLPEPIFTPTTKESEGKHDEAITFTEMAKIIGDRDVAKQVRYFCIDLFEKAYDFFLERDIILADTKFELGLDKDNNVVFGDEILTPDSSRFWDKKTFVPGREPLSYDKQLIRDYLTDCKNRGEDDSTVPEGIIMQTRLRYLKLYEKVIGHDWPD